MLFAVGEDDADTRIEALIRAALESEIADRRFFRQPHPARRLEAPLPSGSRSEKYWELLDKLKEARAKNLLSRPGPRRPSLRADRKARATTIRTG